MVGIVADLEILSVKQLDGCISDFDVHEQDELLVPILSKIPTSFI
jgi:hypothetical protein